MLELVSEEQKASIGDKIRDLLLGIRPADFPDINRHYYTFVIAEKDAQGELMGAVYSYVHPGWVYIDMLWVAAERRGSGLGSRLMAAAEAEAIKRGCHSAYLWTQDFEAPGFYEKQGYNRFVTMEDFIPGHQRIGFRKKLCD